MKTISFDNKQSSAVAGRALVLVTDAFGGYGGISRFNRDLLEALGFVSNCSGAVVFPRLVKYAIEEDIPENIWFVNKGITTKPGYIRNLLEWLLKDARFDMIICGHINLLPIAWPLARLLRLPLVMIIHGIDAWIPTKSRIVNHLASKVDCVVSVSRTSLDRFCGWSGLDHEKTYILPNCVDLSSFTPGPRNIRLVERYGLQDKKVLMTLGRMPGPDRFKGYDEIIEILPRLVRKIPNLVYLLGGNGPDRPRLEQKARNLGVAEHIVFTGMIEEVEKPDHFRLADVYVMPSRGEGFGIVLLEAMACGIPVVASKLDGGREALRDGLLGLLVDPLDPEDIIAGILRALESPTRVPDGLDYFSKSSFQDRVYKLLESVMENKV